MVRLIEDMADPDHPAEAALVLSDKDAPGLEKARALGIEARHLPAGSCKAEFEAAVTAALWEADADLVCLAGFMRILSPEFVSRWEGRILNIHPSLLPLFKGLHTHQRALDAGMAVHGCTVHEVTADLDAGPILGQAVIPVEAGDTAETLAARLLPMEHRLYPAVLRRFAAGDRTPVAVFP